MSPTLSISAGRRVWIGPHATLQGTGYVEFGDHVYAGAYLSINSLGSIKVGERTMLANFVSLIDNNHGVEPNEKMADQKMSIKAISIGRDCWIGEKATILAGVTIGDESVIAAGAVVTRDVAPFTIVAGVPAQPIRTRGTV